MWLADLGGALHTNNHVRSTVYYFGHCQLCYWSYYTRCTSEFDCRLRLKCDGTRAETRFRLSVKWTSPFKSSGASIQSITGSRGVRISGSVMLDTLCSEVV